MKDLLKLIEHEGISAEHKIKLFCYSSAPYRLKVKFARICAHRAEYYARHAADQRAQSTSDTVQKLAKSLNRWDGAGIFFTIAMLTVHARRLGCQERDSSGIQRCEMTERVWQVDDIKELLWGHKPSLWDRILTKIKS